MKQAFFILALILLLVIAPACGGDSATPISTVLSPTATSLAPTVTSALTIEGALRDFAGAVSQARGLEFIGPVRASFVSDQVLADFLSSRIAAQEREELAEIQELYKALGLLDPSMELFPLYLDLLSESIGLFDLETEELLVLAESFPLDLLEELALAHELVHALQQQNFNARALVEEAEGSLDRQLALRALLEGDATFATALYATANFTPAEMQELGSASPGVPAFENAPPIIQETFVFFPYLTGTEFITALWQANRSWDPVNQGYTRPPTSTEQVLHLDKYLADEDPRPVSLPPLLPLLDDDWAIVLEDALGEFILRTYLESALNDPIAARVAAGWGGDRFRLLGNTAGQRIFGFLVEWDTVADAQEFFAAYKGFTDDAGSWVSRDAGVNVVRWQAADRMVRLALDGSLTLVGLSPDPETDALIASAFPQFQPG